MEAPLRARLATWVEMAARGEATEPGGRASGSLGAHVRAHGGDVRDCDGIIFVSNISGVLASVCFLPVSGQHRANFRRTRLR